MDPDSYQQAWQAHSSQTRVTIDADLLLKVVQRDQQNFRSVIRLSDFAGVGIALLLMPMWIYMGVTSSSPWTWYLTVPVLVWWVVFPVVYRMSHRQKPSRPEEPLLHCVECSLTEMDDQIWYQRNSFWWSSLPLFVSMLAFVFHSAWLRSDDRLDFLGHMDEVVFFLAVFYFLYFINNKVGCSKYEPRRQELLMLLKSLRDETISKDAHDKGTAQSASPRTSTALAIVGGLLLLAVLIAVAADSPFQASDPRLQTAGYPKRSPFAAVRWQGSQPEVRLDEEWFKLVSLNELPTSEIVAFSQHTYGSKWRKRFEEDLVELLTSMGHPPQDKVRLVVQSLTSSETWIREDVPMTEENRRAISAAARTRETSEP